MKDICVSVVRGWGKRLMCLVLFSLLISAPLKAQLAHGGISVGNRIKIHSEILNEDRHLWIHLPKDYEKGVGQFPVLFVLDGGYPEIFMEAVSSVYHLERSVDGPDFIIVGVGNTDRNRDLLPEEVVGRKGSGGAEDFCRFLSQELVPYFRLNYRTNYYNILYGGSTAGLFTTFAFLECPETFDAFIASSPLMGQCYDFMIAKTCRFLEWEKFEGRILFIDYGMEDLKMVRMYLPKFYKTLERKAPEHMHMALRIQRWEGHVPYGSLYRGLRYVLKNKD